MSLVKPHRELLAEILAWFLASVILLGGGYIFFKPVVAALTQLEPRTLVSRTAPPGR